MRSVKPVLFFVVVILFAVVVVQNSEVFMERKAMVWIYGFGAAKPNRFHFPSTFWGFFLWGSFLRISMDWANGFGQRRRYRTIFRPSESKKKRSRS